MLNSLLGIDGLPGINDEALSGLPAVGLPFGAAQARCCGGRGLDGSEQMLEQFTSLLMMLLLNLMKAGPAGGAGGDGLQNLAAGGAPEVGAPGALPDAGGAGGAAGGAAAAPAASPTSAPATGRGGFSKPLDGYKVTSGFGPRGNENHGGIDLAAPTGTPVKAAKDGTVSISKDETTGYGRWIEIKHADGSSTRYGHLSARNVQVGQRVTRGQVIGKVGSTGRSTGPHLHFEIRQGGQAVNPRQYLSF